MHNKSLAQTGIGLRFPHMQELLKSKANIGFLEAHSENYFGGGKNRTIIKELSEIYNISLHGVGLSLGRADGLDKEHIRQVKELIDEINPIFVSEHLSWSAYKHMNVPDLLPVPYTNESLGIFVDHVKEFQDVIGRQMLIENPSNYLAFANLDYSEPEFLNKISEQSGCGILLDIENIAVSAHNVGYKSKEYIDAIIDDGRVKQFHLAGYEINKLENGDSLWIDTHGKPVYPEVWDLYEYALKRFGDMPTLIEWDTDIPQLDVLVAEAEKANKHRNKVKGLRDDCAA